jgi:hypothetical protein
MAFLVVAFRWEAIDGATRFGLVVGCGVLFIIGLVAFSYSQRPRH